MKNQKRKAKKTKFQTGIVSHWKHFLPLLHIYSARVYRTTVVTYHWSLIVKHTLIKFIYKFFIQWFLFFRLIAWWSIDTFFAETFTYLTVSRLTGFKERRQENLSPQYKAILLIVSIIGYRNCCLDIHFEIDQTRL